MGLQKFKTLEINRDKNPDGGIIALDSNGNAYIEKMVSGVITGSVLNFSQLPVASGYIASGGQDGDLYYVEEDQGSVLLATKKESGVYKFSSTSTSWKFEGAAVNSFVSEGGVSRKKIKVVTSAYTISMPADDNIHLLVDTSLGDIIITLPLSSSVDDGINFTIENTSTNTVTISPTGSDKINGGSSVSLFAGELYALTNNKSANEWQVYMKEVNPTIGDVSHLVGFYDDDGSLKIDIIPLVNLLEYDVSKYNLMFQDGTPSYVISSNSVSTSIVVANGIEYLS